MPCVVGGGVPRLPHRGPAVWAGGWPPPRTDASKGLQIPRPCPAVRPGGEGRCVRDCPGLRGASQGQCPPDSWVSGRSPGSRSLHAHCACRDTLVKSARTRARSTPVHGCGSRVPCPLSGTAGPGAVAGGRRPGPSRRPCCLRGDAPALTAGFRPSLSRVFLRRGPSMVGAAAELPSAQMHGPVGLRVQHWSDTWRSCGQAPTHRLGPARPPLRSPRAAGEGQHGEGPEAAEHEGRWPWAHPTLTTVASLIFPSAAKP